MCVTLLEGCQTRAWNTVSLGPVWVRVKEQQKNPKQALKQFKSLCSAYVGRVPSFSKTIYCSRPAWLYSPCLMQTARPVFVCLCSSGRWGQGAAWSCGLERQTPTGRVSLVLGQAGLRAPAPAREGQLLQFPAPVLVLDWGSPGPRLGHPRKGAVISYGERRGVGEADWCSRMKRLSALWRRNGQVDSEKWM